MFWRNSQNEYDYCGQRHNLVFFVMPLFILLCVVIYGKVSFAAPLTVTASVDKTTLALNQQLTLTVDISGEGANKIGELELPNTGDFLAYLGSGGTSQSINFINGRMSVQKGYTYYYMAVKEGNFQIAPVQVAYKGKTYKSQPINIAIIKSAPQAQQQQPQTRSRPDAAEPQGSIQGELFVKGLVNKRRVYQNEPVVITYRIYTNVNVTNFGISKLPGTSGFWVEEVPMSRQPEVRQEVINGRKYTTADVKKMILFPTSAGKKTIEPLGLECDVRVQRRRSRDFFDSFFDDPFFGRTVRKAIYSSPITIDVLPLPDVNKPSNFSGAVGHFKLSASVDKNSVKTNEAITLKVKITGQGNIKILPEPEVLIPTDFERYEPKISENIDRSGNTVSGSKTYEYVLVPRFPGTQRISPIKFAYFDIAQKDYRVLRTPEIVIDVAKGKEEYISSGSGFGKEEVRLIGQDIRFIKKSSSGFRWIAAKSYQNPLFIALFILPLLVLVGSWGYRSHLDKLSENVAYARSRKANQMAMSRLRKAKGLLNENTQKEFYAEVARALQGFVGDKLNIAETGLITDQVEATLKSRGGEDEVVRSLVECLQHCDYQRFAPSTSSREEMKLLFDIAKNIIIKLEKSF